MLKEIHEQPDIVRNILNGKLYDIDEPIILDEVRLNKDILKKLDKIQIIAWHHKQPMLYYPCQK